MYANFFKPRSSERHSKRSRTCDEESTELAIVFSEHTTVHRSPDPSDFSSSFDILKVQIELALKEANRAIYAKNNRANQATAHQFLRQIGHILPISLTTKQGAKCDIEGSITFAEYDIAYNHGRLVKRAFTALNQQIHRQHDVQSVEQVLPFLNALSMGIRGASLIHWMIRYQSEECIEAVLLLEQRLRAPSLRAKYCDAFEQIDPETGCAPFLYAIRERAYGIARLILDAPFAHHRKRGRFYNEKVGTGIGGGGSYQGECKMNTFLHFLAMDVEDGAVQFDVFERKIIDDDPEMGRGKLEHLMGVVNHAGDLPFHTAIRSHNLMLMRRFISYYNPGMHKALLTEMMEHHARLVHCVYRIPQLGDGSLLEGTKYVRAIPQKGPMFSEEYRVTPQNIIGDLGQSEPMNSESMKRETLQSLLGSDRDKIPTPLLIMYDFICLLQSNHLLYFDLSHFRSKFVHAIGMKLSRWDIWLDKLLGLYQDRHSNGLCDQWNEKQYFDCLLSDPENGLSNQFMLQDKLCLELCHFAIWILEEQHDCQSTLSETGRLPMPMMHSDTHDSSRMKTRSDISALMSDLDHDVDPFSEAAAMQESGRIQVLIGTDISIQLRELSADLEEFDDGDGTSEKLSNTYSFQQLSETFEGMGISFKTQHPWSAEQLDLQYPLYTWIYWCNALPLQWSALETEVDETIKNEWVARLRGILGIRRFPDSRTSEVLETLGLN